MMKNGFLLFMLLLTSIAFAEDEPMIALEKVTVNIHDKASIRRGGKFVAANCLACHTLIYLRYDPVAQAVGVTYNKMPTAVTNWPFGVKPPDLSLEISRRGADWVYTYLHSFYVDTTRPTGVNNLLIKNTAMAEILLSYQGRQVLLPPAQWGKKMYGSTYQWYDLLELQTPGTLTTAQFDATMMDVVNFLAYASEPYKVEQEHLGWWVLGYLFILFLLVYALKREYWKRLEK